MSARFRVRVQPRSSLNKIERVEAGRLKVWVTAPPAENAANDALCALLAKALAVPKSSVRVVRGHTAREKTVEIDDLAQEDAERRIV